MLAHQRPRRSIMGRIVRLFGASVLLRPDFGRADQKARRWVRGLGGLPGMLAQMVCLAHALLWPLSEIVKEMRDVA